MKFAWRSMDFKLLHAKAMPETSQHHSPPLRLEMCEKAQQREGVVNDTSCFLDLLH